MAWSRSYMVWSNILEGSEALSEVLNRSTEESQKIELKVEKTGSANGFVVW